MVIKNKVSHQTLCYVNIVTVYIYQRVFALDRCIDERS